MENESSVTGGDVVLSGYKLVKQRRGFFTAIVGLFVWGIFVVLFVCF